MTEGKPLTFEGRVEWLVRHGADNIGDGWWLGWVEFHDPDGVLSDIRIPIIDSMSRSRDEALKHLDECHEGAMGLINQMHHGDPMWN